MGISKSVVTVSAVGFALIFGGGAYVLKNINSLAKPVTERIVSEALGVRVSIGGMDISLQDKRVGVSNIRIANPRGFSKPNAVTIESAQVTIGDLKQGLIDLKAIDVSGTNVFLEVKETGTNLQALKNGMKKSETKPDAEPLKVIIRRFALDRAQLHPSVTLIGQQDLKAVAVPPIVLKGIGAKENGVVAADAAQQVIRPLIQIFSKSAGSAGFYDGLSSDVLKDLGASQIKAVQDQITNEVDKIGAGLKGLFQ